MQQAFFADSEVLHAALRGKRAPPAHRSSAVGAVQFVGCKQHPWGCCGDMPTLSGYPRYPRSTTGDGCCFGWLHCFVWLCTAYGFAPYRCRQPSGGGEAPRYPPQIFGIKKLPRRMVRASAASLLIASLHPGVRGGRRVFERRQHHPANRRFAVDTKCEAIDSTCVRPGKTATYQGEVFVALSRGALPPAHTPRAAAGSGQCRHPPCRPGRPVPATSVPWPPWPAAGAGCPGWWRLAGQSRCPV